MGLPPINGVESRLDDLTAEVRGLRKDLGELLQALRPAPPSEPAEGTVELREPKPPRKPRRKG